MLQHFVNLPLPQPLIRPGLESLRVPNDGKLLARKNELAEARNQAQRKFIEYVGQDAKDFPDLVATFAKEHAQAAADNLVREKQMEYAGGAIDDFIRKFGELAPGFPKSRYHKIVAGFRFHWLWATESRRPVRNRKMPVQVALQKERHEGVSKIEKYCADILNRNWDWGEDAVADGAKPLPRPTFGVDFLNGRITVAHETLLDSLVVSLLRYRNGLKVCQHKDCRAPFFYSDHTNQKYCSTKCPAEKRMRRADQKEGNRHNEAHSNKL